MNEQNQVKDIFLINGNQIQSEFIASFIDEQNYSITKFFDGKKALDELMENTDLSKVVVISYQLKNINGLEIMQKLNDEGKNYAFIFLTADKTVERAVEAMKSGALDFIPKTGDIETELPNLIDKAYKFQQEKLEQDKIKKELDEKKEELAKLSVVASETNNAVAIFNSDLEMEWINNSFEKIYGFSLEEYIKEFGISIIETSNNPDIKELVQKCVKEKVPVSYTAENTKKDQSKIWIQTTLSPVLDDDGNIIKLVTIDSDITELKKAEEKILRQKKNITDSINYAKRIQTSILPDEEVFKNYFEESFIFYRPKDVVSGDFPWSFERGKYLYIAAVDCTGHGVPGALLSFVGYFNLINIVDHDIEIETGEILDKLHNNVQETLKQKAKNATTRDGMDIALCKINKETNELEYSGAHRPMYLLNNKNEIEEYKGDRKAIGGIPMAKYKKRKFTTHKVNYEEGQRVFIFSDGLPDQFRDGKPKKFSNKRIKQLIENNNDKDMNAMRSIFENEFYMWKGDGMQLDDVLLIGFKM